MKKKIIFIVLISVVAVLFLAAKLASGAKTLEEAVAEFNLNPSSIIHQEKMDKGTIVFCYQDKGEVLSTLIIKKGIGGYKVTYSGVGGDVKRAAETFGVTNTFFPAIENTPLPVYFGVIGNQEISKVKVVEKKRNLEEDAKIIKTDKFSIWLTPMSRFEGSEFEIVGLSKDEKELVRIKENIAPWSAEQKPFKGYK